MADFLVTLLGIILCLLGVMICWTSTKILDERKQNWRKGLTDYYGNPINKSKLVSNTKFNKGKTYHE